MDATEVQLSQDVDRTPDDILERYRQCRNWRLYQKEWIYRNFAPAGRAWLDFGCGTGEITTQLALLGASRVVAVDVTPGLLEMTRRRAELDGVSGRVDTICGHITEIEPRPVDVVLCYAVLHHLPDSLAEVMPVFRRWLKPGGAFIAVEPVSYLSWLEWLRQHSGVRHDALDPGERKLRATDLQRIENSFVRAERTHFHCFGRLTRLFPRADRLFRRMDSFFLSLPGARFFAGTVIEVCHVD
jgi:SAM-dependent methyltransferase